MYRHNGRALETSARAEQSTSTLCDLINAMSFSRILCTRRDPPDRKEREISFHSCAIRQMKHSTSYADKKIFACPRLHEMRKKYFEM